MSHPSYAIDHSGDDIFTPVVRDVVADPQLLEQQRSLLPSSSLPAEPEGENLYAQDQYAAVVSPSSRPETTGKPVTQRVTCRFVNGAGVFVSGSNETAGA